jgi:hypothetical protein
MPKSRLFLFALPAVLTAFLAGRWSCFSDPVKADSGDNAQIEVREVTGVPACSSTTRASRSCSFIRIRSSDC